MPETTATPDAAGTGAVAQARASHGALKDAIKEAQQAWPEDEDQDDLGEPAVADDQDEDAEPAETPGEDTNAADLRDLVAELRAEVAELKQSRTSPADSDVSDEDLEDVLPEGWEGLSPYAKAQTKKMLALKAELSVKQERLDATVSLIAFKQDHPDWKKYEGQIVKHLQSNRFNTGNYSEDLDTIYEHVTGQEAKKELTRRVSTEKARSESGALSRNRPVRPGSEPSNVTKLPSFGEAYANAVRTTVAKKASRGR